MTDAIPLLASIINIIHYSFCDNRLLPPPIHSMSLQCSKNTSSIHYFQKAVNNVLHVTKREARLETNEATIIDTFTFLSL